MAQNIHPTAYIAPDVALGDNVTLALLGPLLKAVLRWVLIARLALMPVVHGHVRMGAGNILHPHAVLGGLPQDTGFKAETVPG